MNRPPPLGLPDRDELADLIGPEGGWVVLGRGVRVVFFVGAAVGLWAYVQWVDWAAFNTPLAEVTMASLGKAFFHGTVVVTLSIGGLRWALTTGEKYYEAWGRFGLAMIGIGLFYVAAKNGWLKTRG